MAEQTSARVTIDAAPEVVLDVIGDLAAYPAWSSDIKAVEVLEETDDGRPLRARFSLASRGLSDDYTLLYAWSEAGVSWQLAEPSALQKSQTGSYVVTGPEEGPSEVRYDLTIDAKLPMIGPLRRKIERQVVATALEGLKARVESLG